MKIWILALFISIAVGTTPIEVHHRQTRNIAGFLENLLDLTGIRDLLPWVQEKIQTDPDLQRFVKYLASGKLDAILDHLRGCPGYPEVKDELAKEGVDLDNILRNVRNFVTGKITIYHKIQARQSLGELLNEFFSRIHVDDLIITDGWYRWENDQNLKKLIDLVKGDTFQGIITCMKDSKEVYELKEKLEDEGIDVASLIELIKYPFEDHYYSVQSRTIGTLLKDLVD